MPPRCLDNMKRPPRLTALSCGGSPHPVLDARDGHGRMQALTVPATRRPALAAAAALALCAASPALAAPVPWSEEPLTYTVVDQDLRELLAEVGTRLGVSVQVSPAVKARVRGRLPSAPPQEFLSRLAAIYGFEWYYDGSTLWVTAPSEKQTRMMPLDGVTVDQINLALDELGASDARFPLRGSVSANQVVVSGPPQFVAIAERTLQALQSRNRPNVSTITVFRGQR